MPSTASSCATSPEIRDITPVVTINDTILAAVSIAQDPVTKIQTEDTIFTSSNDTIVNVPMVDPAVGFELTSGMDMGLLHCWNTLQYTHQLFSTQVQHLFV